MAEYFRDVRTRTCCCSSTTSSGSPRPAPRCRPCSAGCLRRGLPAHLADEMGVLQERITSTRGRSITSMQAVYVPADDYTDPAPATTFAHLDATTELSHDEIASLGIYPAVDPLASTSRILDPQYIGERHYNAVPGRCRDPAAQQGTPGHHRDPRCRRALRRGQDHRVRAPPDPAVPCRRTPRGQAVHRHRGA